MQRAPRETGAESERPICNGALLDLRCGSATRARREWSFLDVGFLQAFRFRGVRPRLVERQLLYAASPLCSHPLCSQRLCPLQSPIPNAGRRVPVPTFLTLRLAPTDAGHVPLPVERRASGHMTHPSPSHQTCSTSDLSRGGAIFFIHSNTWTVNCRATPAKGPGRDARLSKARSAGRLKEKATQSRRQHGAERPRQ